MSETEDDSGLLPAALAGAGILLFAALLIFGTGDDAEATAKDAPPGSSAAADRADARTGRRGGVAARPTDSAERDAPPVPMPQPPKARVNPQVKRLMVTGEMKDPPPVPPGPPTFETPDEERQWYQRQLDGAKRLLDNRRRALDKFPKLEEDARNSPNPDAALDALAQKKSHLEKAIEDSEAKVREYEAKLAELG